MSAAPALQAVPDPIPHGPYFRVPELAALWNVSPAHVWKLIYSGELGSVLLGRSRRIPAECADAFIRAGMCPAKDEVRR
jgi:excisionase family DNA binding protein